MVSNSPKISIVVPCFKVEKFLPKCLDSLIRQTFTEIEVICVNDGSPDGCIDILRDYESCYPEIIKVIDKQNEGVLKARNDGIALARGEYVGFVDGDDFVEPNFCKELYDCIIESDADIAVCGFRRIDDTTGKTLNIEINKPRNDIIVKDNPGRLLEINGALWNKLFKADLLKNIYKFNEQPAIYEDIMLQLLIFPYTRRIAFTPSVLVNYVVHSDSSVNTIDKSKIMPTYNAMLEVKDFYLNNNHVRMLPFLDAAAFLHLGISLIFRASYDYSVNLFNIVNENRKFLDKHFSSWNDSSIISKNNAKKYKGVLKKAYYARKIYNSVFFIHALSVYRFMISKFGMDIKW